MQLTILTTLGFVNRESRQGPYNLKIIPEIRVIQSQSFIDFRRKSEIHPRA